MKTLASDISSTSQGKPKTWQYSLGAAACSIAALALFQACTPEETYEVATWSGFRTAAISYTFDDGTPGQFSKAVPMFNEAGYKMTLFTVTEPEWAFSGWEALQAAADAGHEVASHTCTHPNLAELPLEAQAHELEVSRQAIEAHIKQAPGITLAYPYCVPGDPKLTAANYFAARTCSGEVIPASPEDFMQLSSVGCGSLSNVNDLASFQQQAQRAADTGGWMVYLLHGVDDDGGYSPVTSETLQDTLNYFKTNDATYWVETFGNIARYIMERDNLSIQETSATAERITLHLTDSLDDAIYQYPVTLRRDIPAAWNAVRVTQAGRVIPASLLSDDSGKRVQFDAIPDAGEVIIESDSLDLAVERAAKADQASVRPFDKAPTADLPAADLTIPASDQRIRYSGRTIGQGTDSVAFGYSGARVRLLFSNADSVSMELDDESGRNYVLVFIDGQATEKILLNAENDLYQLAKDLQPGIHTIEVVRITECDSGPSHFKGFQLSGKDALALPWESMNDRKIEFIGDSITCGYGVEIDDPNIGFDYSSENFCLGYSGLTARALDADYLVVSRSGIGMLRNFDGPTDGSENNMPDNYFNVFYERPESGLWDSSQYTPDVVCINLGTNDFSTTGCNIDKYISNYTALAGEVLKRYPKAQLVIIQGSMENSDALKQALAKVKENLTAIAPGRVNSLALTPIGELGFGADWHPNRAQSIVNAKELTHYLSELLDWK